MTASRESRYTPELAAAVIHRVSNGETLRRICRDVGIPESTFRTWVRDDRDGLAVKYHQARLLQIDAWSDELLDVGYNPEIDPATKRVIGENLRWLLSKLAPTRFGDRLLVSGDPANPIQLLHKQVSLKELSNDALDALQAFCNQMLLEHQPADAEVDQHRGDERHATPLLEHRRG